MIHERQDIHLRIALTDDVCAVELQYPHPYSISASPLVFDGWSKRRPGDPRDSRIGRDVAVLRALRGLVAHLEATLPLDDAPEPTPEVDRGSLRAGRDERRVERIRADAVAAVAERLEPGRWGSQP